MDYDLEEYALDVISNFEYAMEHGDSAVMPDLDELRFALERLMFHHGMNGLEASVAPLRRAVRGPDVKSYREVARLIQGLMLRLYPVHQEPAPGSLDDVPF